MRRLAAVSGATLLAGVILVAQEAPTMSEEPSHKRLLFTGNMRVFEINVAAGGANLDHFHDRDVVTVALGPATLRTRQTGADWSEPRSYAPGTVNVANYTGAPVTHRMENVGKTPYRVFAVENLRDKGWTMPRLIEAPGTKVVEQTRSFAVYDVRLTANTLRTNHVHEQPTVVILLSGAVEVQGGGGESEFRMETPGRWFPSQWDQPHALSLLGAADAHLMEVEAR